MHKTSLIFSQLLSYLTNQKQSVMEQSKFQIFKLRYLFLLTIISLASFAFANYSVDAAELNPNVVIDKQDLLLVLEPLTITQLQGCETLYQDYTNLLESDFAMRYLYHKFAGNCVMLFDDPVWGVVGDERYDVLSLRLTQLVEDLQEELSQRGRAEFFITPKSLTELQIPGSYLFIFEGCSGNKAISVNDLAVASDKQIVSLVKSQLALIEVKPGTCRSMEIHIRADDPSTIRVLVPGGAVSVATIGEIKSATSTQQATPRLQNQPIEKTRIRLIDLLHVDRPLTENEIKECETYHNEYSTSLEDSFSTRYQYHKFMGDCILLYNDPIWGPLLENRVDELNQRLADLREQNVLVTSEQILTPTTKQMALVELEIKRDLFSETSVQGKYVFSFQGCTVGPVNLDDMMVSSDKETVSVFPAGIVGGTLRAGECREFEVQIYADDPNTIRPGASSILAYMSPRAQMAQGTPASEVVCKGELELIFKSSDGSAACVKPSSATKLVAWGWGTQS